MRFIALLLLYIAISCTPKTYPALRYDEHWEKPTFRIGRWYAGTAYIFHDSIVYNRSWSDVGPSRNKIYPTAKWNWKTDSTISLTSLRSREEHIFFVNKEKSSCQLLIPIDSLDRFNKVLYPKFKKQIIDWTYEPDSIEQELIEEQKFLYDDTTFYYRLESANIEPIIVELMPELSELGIWYGNGI